MGGTAANRITSAGSSIDGATLGASGGAQSVTLTSAQIPAHTHANTLNDPGHTHTANLSPRLNTPVNQSAAEVQVMASVNGNAVTNSSTTGITITNASIGGDGAHTNMPPAFVCPVIMRII